MPCERPTAAPSAASAEPTTKAIANVFWMLSPSAEVICAVVDARADDLPGPRAVEPEPEADPDQDAEREHDEPGERVVDVPDLQVDPPVGPARPREADGVAAADLVGPGLGKWAITWSATITETAIVISAWRRSWPWFQRSNSCWTTSPTTATIAAATSTGSTHSHG